MKIVPPVALVTNGLFHYGDLAQGLARQGMLAGLFTGMPRWRLKAFDLPYGAVHSFPWLQFPYACLSRLGLGEALPVRRLAAAAAAALDRHVAATLPDCGLLLAMSTCGLRGGQAAQARGIPYFCERASSHIRVQDAVIGEEWKRCGLRWPGIDSWTIEREEAEYAAADAIMVMSEISRRSFINQGIPAEKLRVVPPVTGFGRGVRPRRPPPSGPLRFLFIGAVAPHKGVRILLEAFQNVRRSGQRLTLVGVTPPHGRAIMAKACLDGVDSVGPVPHHAVYDIIDDHHALILPSLEDGYGMVALEAMTRGRPVIVSNQTGAADAVVHGVNGLIVRAGSEQSLGEAMEMLSDTPEMVIKMGEAAAKHAENFLQNTGVMFWMEAMGLLSQP